MKKKNRVGMAKKMIIFNENKSKIEYYQLLEMEYYADKLRDTLTQTYIKHIQWQLKWNEAK